MPPLPSVKAHRGDRRSHDASSVSVIGVTLKDIALTTLDGKLATLAELSDGATLIVNVASKCGLTPQYTALEKLANDYRDRGLTVVGVPCNQFMGQEPGTPEEIKRFGKELDEYRSELFKKEYLPKVRSFPKVRELFQRIHDENKRIVLASSGKKTDTKYYIDLLKVGNLIDGYVSGDDADSSKPAPDVFGASLEKLGKISPANAVTVGDTRFDIEAAAKASLKTIAFLCGGTSESVLREAGAVAIYRDPADFLAHYDELTI